MQAAFFRQVLATRSFQDRSNKASSAASKAQTQGYSSAESKGQQQEGSWSRADLDGMLAESLQYAKADVKRFVQETQRAGWNVHPIMLSSYERATFSPV